MKQGTVYWITGLAGAGKTTIGKMFYGELKQKKANVVLFDGDTLRDVFEHTGYSYQDRLNIVKRHLRLADMLVKQEIDIVFCTIAMFDEIREWNRSHFENYKEVYLDVPMAVLRKRDQKNLYSSAESGKIKDVVGVDITAEKPKNPDMTILNDGSKTPEKIVQEIWDTVCVKPFDEI